MQMSDKGLAAWGEPRGLPVPVIKRMRRLINKISAEVTHWASGDWHPRTTGKDRETHGNAWDKDSEETKRSLERLAAKYGYGVDYPTHIAVLTKDGDVIHVPT